MFKRILEKVTMPKITLPTVKFSLPSVKVPTITIPIKKIVTVLGIINTSILITIGGLGLFVSYINPIPWITPYIQFSVANQLFEYVQYLQANSIKKNSSPFKINSLVVFCEFYFVFFQLL